MKKKVWKERCAALEVRLQLCGELHRKTMAEKAELNRCYDQLREQFMERVQP